MKDSIVTTNKVGNVTVASLPHPFRVEAKQFTVPYGTSLLEILLHAQPDERLRQHITVDVNGYRIPSEWWPYYYPKTNTTVGIRILPSGGGDGEKNPQRTILLILLAWAGGAVAGGALQGTAIATSTGLSFAAGSASALAAAAAVTLVGRLLIDAIAPPPSLDGDSIKEGRTTFSINGARNRLIPYGAIPRVYGRHLMVPPYAAKPFTEVRGSDQFFYGLFLWGYGPIEVDTLRIGDTAIDNFQDVEVSHNLDGTGWSNGDIFNNSVDQDDLNILLEHDVWNIRTTSDVADEISVDIAFPTGLIEHTKEGKINYRSVAVRVELAEAGTGNWFGVQTAVSAQSASYAVPPPRESKGGPITGEVKARVVINKATGSAQVLQSERFYFLFHREISTPTWAYSIATMVISSDGSITITNEGDESGKHSGFDVSAGAGNTVDITAGTLEAIQFAPIRKKGDPFRLSATMRTPDGTKQYDVRLKRTTAESSSRRVFDEVRWITLRAIQFSAPVNRTDVALTAIRIRASDQLSGIIDEFNGRVQGLMYEYDTVNNAWNADAIASSPAAAYRDVLTGPATERGVDVSRLELPDIESWAEYADSKGFEFNYIFDRQVSVTDALDLITTAGRAAKSLKDGKWTVVVDEPKTAIAQHFTPRNIISYEGEKAFHEKTHAIRAQFLNKDVDYQADELIVYNDGFTADGNAPAETPPFPDSGGGYSVATKFEEIEYPGLTSEAEVHKASRYHLAVDELRPERHTLIVDIEFLRVQRGQLFRMAHDVPEWGTGYGRIKSITVNGSNELTEFALDSDVILETGNDYVARFRLSDGTDVLEDLVDPGSDVTTDTFTPTTPIAAPHPEVGDLVAIGISMKETVVLLAKSVEPNDDWQAAIVGVDEAPGVHNAADENIPTFDPRITQASQWSLIKPPIPIVQNIASDETALVQGPGGDLIAQIILTLTTTSSTGKKAEHFQARYRETPDATTDDNLTADTDWTLAISPAKDGLLRLTGVRELVDYDIEVRSVGEFGVTSDWVVAATAYTVTGKTNPPDDVTNFAASTTNWISGDSKQYGIHLTWDDIGDLDLGRYEVRTDTNFGAVSGRLARPKDNQVQLPIAEAGSYTFYIEAQDTSGNYSANATSVAITINAPAAPALSSRFEGPDFVLRWTEVEGDFPTAFYDVRRGGTDFDDATPLDTVQARELKLKADWTGSETWRIAAIDVAGNVGASASTDVSISGGSVSGLSAQVIDNNVLLRWNKTAGTLPIETYQLRKGSVFSSAEVLGTVDSTFEALFETVSGQFTYWVVPVDTAGNLGTESSITADVSEPPDFVLTDDFEAQPTWSGTKTNAFVGSANELIVPVDTTETWDDHFTNNSWSTVQDQIDAGYPIYIQPTLGTAQYEEVYDLGTEIAVSTIARFTWLSEDIVAGATVTPTVSVAPDSGGSPGTWRSYSGQSSVLESNFRFVRVTLDFSQGSDDALLKVLTLNTAVQTKTITDEGIVSADAADESTGGTTVTFNKSFADITAITVNPNNDDTLTALYNFTDVANPTDFKVLLYDNWGVPQSGEVRWIVRGIKQ